MKSSLQALKFQGSYLTLKKEKTTCPFCYSEGVLEIIRESEKLFLKKVCPVHGEYKLLLSDNPKHFEDIINTIFEKTQLPHTFLFTPSKKDWVILKYKYRSFLISITEKCNSNCNICYVDNIPHKDVPFKEIKNIIKKLGKGKNILLFGGEPTVRKDIFKIIKFIKKIGDRAILFTNGLKLANLKYVKKLKEAGISEVRISFDGFREEIYQVLRNDKNQLYKKLLALKNLKKLNIPTTISFTAVSGVNLDQILPVFIFAIQCRKFIRRVTIVPFTPEGRLNIKVEKVISPYELLKYIENVTYRKITVEYYHQFQLFKRNITKVLLSLHLTKNVAPAPDILFKIGSIKEFIPLQKLEKINKLFSKNKILGIFELLKESIKNKEVFKFIFSYLLNGLKFRFDNISKNVLSFYIVPMGSFFYIPGERETASINFSPSPEGLRPIVYIGGTGGST
jgi:MoaA/NifB/PqqE/SkfB family radical SAM enzyme